MNTVLMRVATWIGARLAAERARWILWAPVGLGVGIGAYFSLPVEPALWIGTVGIVASGVLGIVARRSEYVLISSIVLGVVFGGFAVAQWRTFALDHVVLERALNWTTVTGRIASAEQLSGGTRVILEHVRMSGLEPPATPERVRVRLRGEMTQIVPGAWIEVRARMSPPPPPAMPGSYDFQFLSYFQEIGATGFALGAARVIPGGGENPTLAHRWEGVRERLSARIRASIGGATGAVAAALITGDRGAIPEEINEAYRNSGIYHLLSISGMHIGLVAGLLFALMRALLALIPSIALNYPIKKWAAVAAICGALFYTLLAGATVPTQRSFLMMGLVLAAVVFDRQGISMRFVAIAAAVILAFQPESLLNVSFQMSFAAVVALIAAYEVWGAAFARGKDRGMARRVALYVAAVALTTVIATVATAPFSVYHFNRVALYGLLGNLVAVPVSSVWVMPAAVVGVVLMPFGLEDFGLIPMGWGIDVINASAVWIASGAWAVTTVAAMPSAALVAMVLGGAWMCLWRTSWRGLGLGGIAIGIVLAAVSVPPDILVDGSGRLFAVAGRDGRLLVSSRTTARFERDIWLRRAGFAAGDEQSWAQAISAPQARTDVRCDSAGCLWSLKGNTVAFSTTRAALVDDCRKADIVVSAVPVPARRCPSARVLIDRYDLWRNGTHAVWLSGDRVRIESVNGVRGTRPWVYRPHPRAAQPSAKTNASDEKDSSEAIEAEENED